MLWPWLLIVLQDICIPVSYTHLIRQKWRDLLKSVSVKYTGNMYIVLIGIEAQTDVHYAMPVSYTHLDVYKRQVVCGACCHSAYARKAVG